MILAELTSPREEALSRELVVLLPTGSLEQHGSHLPLFTDSLLVEAVAKAVETYATENCLLLPTQWLGCSAHHLGFSGSLSSGNEAYSGHLKSVVRSLQKHGFRKFMIINGHGGNSALNEVTLRELKEESPNDVYVNTDYFTIAKETIAQTLTGRFKHIRHACEGETSLMLYLFPDLVQMNLARSDGLASEPFIPGLVTNFEEISEAGSLGDAPLATAEKGKIIFESTVIEIVRIVDNLAKGFVFSG